MIGNFLLLIKSSAIACPTSVRSFCKYIGILNLSTSRSDQSTELWKQYAIYDLIVCGQTDYIGLFLAEHDHGRWLPGISKSVRIISLFVWTSSVMHLYQHV